MVFWEVVHHFPSANCHDIAFSLLRRGLISLGGTSSLLGLVYPSWQVKKLRFKRQEMLLSDLSCCCQLQEPEAPHCHPCTTPWRMATLKHHRCGLSSCFVALGSSFQKWSFWAGVISFFTIFILFKQLGIFLKQSVFFAPEALGKWGSTTLRLVQFNAKRLCGVQLSLLQ